MIKYTIEKFKQVHKDIEELLVKHFNEITVNKEKKQLSVNVPLYEKEEQFNRLKICTVRDDDRLVGYIVAFVTRHPHFAHKAAYFDVYYLLPDYRKNGIGKGLFLEMERALKEDDVKEILAGTKVKNDVSPLFNDLGWTLIEHRFAKWIGE